MIPVNDFLYEDESVNKDDKKNPDLAWKIAEGRIAGKVDKLSAVIQAAIKRLNTESGIYDIYLENYGLKTLDLIGKDIDYSVITLKRRISQSLMLDDRILNIDFLNTDINDRAITLYFEVQSIYGGFELERRLKV
nr:MAG TPA: Protein of unknown function (DUF2634) [Caudoviricetes sp.]